MIIDTSALLSIVLEEPDASTFLWAMVAASSRALSVANWIEATMVVEGRGGPEASTRLDEFIREARIELVAVSLEQAVMARQAWRRFGRGNHSAKLNFGDCFVYALAKTANRPLLFKGDDFVQTDIEPALKD